VTTCKYTSKHPDVCTLASPVCGVATRIARIATRVAPAAPRVSTTTIAAAGWGREATSPASTTSCMSWVDVAEHLNNRTVQQNGTIER
jgi:hypothetical protein